MPLMKGAAAPRTPIVPDPPGVSRIDPSDPAAPMYRLLSKLRTPVTLRDIMIRPVRTGYIGDHPIDPKSLPPSAAELYPAVRLSEFSVEAEPAPIRCELYSPPGKNKSRPMLIYLHGGGFTVGQATDTAYITSRLAVENDLLVVSVNYRLAPEWPFPAGMDDSLAVLKWMRERGAELGGDPSCIVAAGDSAGANMAAALPLKARHEGVRPPEALLLMCPITDFFFERHPSFERLAPIGIVYDLAFAGFIRGAYVLRHADWEHPHVSPAFGDLASYPPTVIVSGTADPLIDDNREFARRLKAAGREVEHFVKDHMPHGYYFFPGVFAEGDEAFSAMRAFLVKALRG